MSSNLAPATSNDNVDKKESTVAFTPSPHLSAEMSPELSPQFGALQIDSQTHDVDNTTGQTGTNGNDQSQEPRRKRSVYTIDSKKRCEKLFPSTINCCGKWKISRFQYLSFCRLIVILGILSTYLVYQLIYYFNPMTNSKQWVDVDTTDTYPMPYLYIEWNLSLTNLQTYDNNYTWICNYYVDNTNSTKETIKLTYENITDMYGINNDNEMKLLLNDYKDNWLTIEYNLNNELPWSYANGYRTQGEILIIPPYGETATVTIETGNINTDKNSDSDSDSGGGSLLHGDLFFIVRCWAYNTSQQSYYPINDKYVSDDLYSSIVYYHINTRKSLLNYDNLNTFFSKNNNGISDYADLALGGYFATLEYEWFHFDNNVKGSEGYNDDDYLVSQFSGIFDIISYFNAFDYFYYYTSEVFGDIIYLQIKPDSAGKKTTFKTRKVLNWVDVLSNIGGFYSSFAGIIAIVFIILVWGFDVDLGKYAIKFRGLDEQATERMSKKEEKKLEKFIKQYVVYQLAKQQKEQKQQKQD